MKRKMLPSLENQWKRSNKSKLSLKQQHQLPPGISKLSLRKRWLKNAHLLKICSTKKTIFAKSLKKHNRRRGDSRWKRMKRLTLRKYSIKRRRRSRSRREKMLKWPGGWLRKSCKDKRMRWWVKPWNTAWLIKEWSRLRYMAICKRSQRFLPYISQKFNKCHTKALISREAKIKERKWSIKLKTKKKIKNRHFSSVDKFGSPLISEQNFHI